ncbi:MAG: hypothetical protein ABSG33_05115 [Candidatus Bathyarchaeia archaeon]
MPILRFLQYITAERGPIHGCPADKPKPSRRNPKRNMDKPKESPPDGSGMEAKGGFGWTLSPSLIPKRA